MITAKKQGLLVLFLISALLFCSCQTDTSGLSPLHSLENGESEETRTPAAEHDYVILPASADDVLTARAHALCEALTARTGIPATLFFDDASLPERDNVRLILLGNTAHALSYKHLHTLRRDDYLCVTDGSALILGGKSDESTVAAIDRFCEALLPYADASILVNQDQHFLVRATYDVDAISLNGFSLADYRLVYPKKNEHGEQAVARALREAIADRCGFYLEVLPDSLVSEHTRVIAVGACFGEEIPNETQFLATGSHVSLCGTSEHALATVAQAFCEHLLPSGTHASLSVSLETPTAVSVTFPSLPVFTGLLDEKDPLQDVNEIARLSTALQNADALFAPFGKMKASSLTYLQTNLPTYACTSLTLGADRVLPLFYRADALTLFEDREVGGIHVLRFSVRGTSDTFTVCHATANTLAAAEAVLQTASQSLSADELCLLLVATPHTLSLSPSEDLFDTIGITEGVAERMHVLLHRPGALASTTAVPPEEANDPYLFTLTHPFLRK